MKTASADMQFDNHLLASLPGRTRDRLQPFLEPCSLPLGKVLYEAGSYIHHIYFPVDSIVSLLYVTTEGNSAEIAVVGNEGVVGVAQFLGGDSSNNRAVVQSAGSAYRISTRQAMAEFDLHTDFMVRILRYVQALMTQSAQTAVCNKHHSVDQQLCRWLLLSIDCLPSRELVMTDKLVSNMLGLSSQGVTAVAGRLQERGVIEYAHGHIRVLNRNQLEQLSCECYRTVKMETNRLLYFRGGYHPAPSSTGSAPLQL
jgi:CRP-like cAMP-binding protein